MLRDGMKVVFLLSGDALGTNSTSLAYLRALRRTSAF